MAKADAKKFIESTLPARGGVKGVAGIVPPAGGGGGGVPPGGIGGAPEGGGGVVYRCT